MRGFDCNVRWCGKTEGTVIVKKRINFQVYIDTNKKKSVFTIHILYGRTFFFSHLHFLFQLYWSSWWTENRSNSWSKGIPGTAQQNPQVNKLWLHFASKLSMNYSLLLYLCTKKKFSIKDFFSKCDQIRRKLRIWSKKYLMQIFLCVCRGITLGQSIILSISYDYYV